MTATATMPEYSKIHSPYTRDRATGKWNVGDWTCPEFALLRDAEWTWTEKLDGTNVRIGWDGESVRVHGRTDNAQMPVDLMAWIQSKVTASACIERFVPRDGEPLDVTIYGEGIGPKIQKNGALYGELRVVVFDINIRGVWLKREAVENTAAALGLSVAPVVHVGSIASAIDFVRAGFQSRVSAQPKEAEGLVGRLNPELLDRRGHRIITKVKAEDVRKLA